MGIVKGFTDIIAPQNLATNGSFRINQRGLFTSGLADAKVGDFVSDVWEVWASTSVDYLQLHNSTAGGEGYVRCKGYGKKNQLVYLYSKRSFDDIKIMSSQTRLATHTAAVTIKGGLTTVPLEARVTGLAAASSTYPYVNNKLVRKNEIVEVVRTDSNPIGATTLSTGNSVQVLLLADGEFDFYIYNYRLFSGSYVNPPQEAFLNYADDLLRCKRYFQTCQMINTGTYLDVYNGSTWVHYQNLVFPVEMAGTPTSTILYSGSTEGTETTFVENHAGHTYLIGSIGTKSCTYTISKAPSGNHITGVNINASFTV